MSVNQTQLLTAHTQINIPQKGEELSVKTSLKFEVIQGLTGETLAQLSEGEQGENLAFIFSFALNQSGVHLGYPAVDLKSRQEVRVWSETEVLHQLMVAIEAFRTRLSPQQIEALLDQDCLNLIDLLKTAIAAQGYLRVFALA